MLCLDGILSGELRWYSVRYTCNGLQVDSTSKLSAEDTNRPEPQRLRTFVIAETIQDWQRSAEAGCPTCRLVWDTLVRFDRDSVLEELIRVSSLKNYDDAVYRARGRSRRDTTAGIYPAAFAHRNSNRRIVFRRR